MTERNVDDLFAQVTGKSGARSIESYRVIHQRWIESERGWGIRADGYSMHLTLEDRVKFIEAYWKTMPDTVPDEYSRPSGNPEDLFVTKTIYHKLQKARREGRFGLRYG